jgi:E3 ubiquitin-protein ligase synoviolin
VFGTQPPVPSGQAAPNVATPHNPYGQGAGVIIQYNIQYQQQLGNQPVQLPAEVPTLHPIPRYGGFYGPGGVWQDWPRQFNNQHRPLEQRSTDARSSEVTTPAQPVSASASQAEGSGGLSRQNSMSEELSSEVENARAAAARAALRRFGESKVSSSSRTSDAAPTDPSVESHQRNSGSQPTPTMVASSPTLQPSESHKRSTVPSLIPLGQHLGAWNRHSGTLPLPVRPNGHQDSRQTFQNLEQSTRHANQQLSDLTEQQLSVMDRLTREAIDERLRVLEGVSTNISRCVDDLLRMRSVLPMQEATTSPIGTASQSGVASQPMLNGHRQQDPKGKQREPTPTSDHVDGGPMSNIELSELDG